MSDELIERLKERACPDGLSHTADEPWSDHGHTDCWLHWQAADALAAAEARIEAAKAVCVEARSVSLHARAGTSWRVRGKADFVPQGVTTVNVEAVLAALTGEADDE